MLDILAMVSQEQEKSVIQRQEPPPVFDQQQPYLMPLNSDLYHTTNVPLPVVFEPQIDQVGASSSFYSFSSSSSSSLQSLQSSSKPCIGCNSNPRLPNRTLCHTCFRDYQREWNKKNRSATRSTKHVSISSTGFSFVSVFFFFVIFSCVLVMIMIDDDDRIDGPQHQNNNNNSG